MRDGRDQAGAGDPTWIPRPVPRGDCQDGEVGQQELWVMHAEMTSGTTPRGVEAAGWRGPLAPSTGLDRSGFETAEDG
jgi:hypothetical protein